VPEPESSHVLILGIACDVFVGTGATGVCPDFLVSARRHVTGASFTGSVCQTSRT
jgi:hypothetical protein